MPLTLTADKIDDIPEGLRDSAKEIGGKWVVSAMKDGWAIEDISGLKKTLAEERKARKDYEAKLKDFEGIDDPQTALDALEKLRAGGLKSSKEIEEFKKTLEAKVAKDLQTANAERDSFRSQAEQLLVDSQLRDALAKAGANPLGMEYLPDRIKAKHVKVERDVSGKLSVQLLDRDGKPMISGKAGSGDPMTFAEFVTGLKADATNAAFFNGSGAGGAGASSQHGGAARAAITQGNNLSSRELLGRANTDTASR